MVIAQFVADVQAEFATDEATEHTYRPALKKLMETLNTDNIRAINEPKQQRGNAPDFHIRRDDVLTIGFIEAKDLDKKLNKIEKDEQLTRYRNAYDNLLLTNHLEFRWYREGEFQEAVTIGKLDKGKLTFDSEAFDKLDGMLRRYAQFVIPVIVKPEDLAERMAKMARELSRLIEEALDNPTEDSDLPAKKAAVEQVLIPNMSNRQFADMFAQTIAYGLFAARARFTGAPEQFTLETAFFQLPKSNPFLKKLFQNLATELDKRVKHMADLIAQLLAYAKGLDDVIADFGKSTKRQDPVIHFYETFLAAYDQSQREKRGVYYTPEPVVSYIVRSVDHILKTTFGRTEGLADEKTLILDPATGTGTFLYQVIQHIHDSMSGNMGIWKSYVQKNLLPRIFGFELLMAPYTIAHMKLNLLLGELGYDFNKDERLGIYLTNTLEESVKKSEYVFAKWINDEADAAAKVKRDEPIMVILGNPPYSNFGQMNKGEWITEKMKDWKPEGEKKWNPDDYMKFMRFSQWRIEKTGSGIVAFVVSHSFLQGITHRQMRKSLMETFTDIHILDLHGNNFLGEIAPDEQANDNVFDIRQGVAIVLLVKDPEKTGMATVHHADNWGRRREKYDWLVSHDVSDTDWEILSDVERETCLGNFYFFAKQGFENIEGYCKGQSVENIFSKKIAVYKPRMMVLFISMTKII